MEIYSIWVKAQNDSLRRVGGLIDDIAQAEGTEKFEPHVTLVSSIYSLEKAEEILDKIVKKKINVSFDSYSTGNSYFQRLYLTSSDNLGFFNAISGIEGWPSLWIPHLSLYYGNELPNVFSLDQINKEIPVEAVFDKLQLCITGPDISEWKEVTSVFLD